MKILIIKTGALGDVVRTQYFAKYLVEQRNCEITWLTSPQALDILKRNPYIKNITVEPNDLINTRWDEVYSLEDEESLCNLSNMIKTQNWIGLKIHNGSITYDNLTQEWNDMGMHSRFGIEIANSLKLRNINSHIKIFENIFNVKNVIPNWNGVINKTKDPKNSNLIVGCNFFAGNRWPNKSLNMEAIKEILKNLREDKRIDKIIILGELDEVQLNNLSGLPKTIVACTNDDINQLFTQIRNCDFLITSDSLAVHISMAARTPFVCFFGPTSATEISDPTLKHINVKSIGLTYCSYNPRAEIIGLTSSRIFESLNNLIIDYSITCEHEAKNEKF